MTRSPIELSDSRQTAKMTACDNDYSEQPANGRERPLDEKLHDNFEVEKDDMDSLNLTGAIELHRLACIDFVLERRVEEINDTIINATCSFYVGFSEGYCSYEVR